LTAHDVSSCGVTVLYSVYGVPFALLWSAWLVYWLVAARDVKATRRRERFATRFLHVALMALGGVLLAFHDLPLRWLDERFLPLTMATYWLGLLMLVAGIGFAVWSRRTLGRNWSGTVTVKHDHELVRTGPYRFVRHPIYTGLLLAILGTAVAIGEWRGLVAFALITASLLIKMTTEERFMSETFADAYARYRTEVAALIPFIV
jgi:protein-S-isoprenylcysteine O-methyltransferase Ste14